MSRRRDKEATKDRLLDAVGQVLERDGFSGLGVNAVARQAGVDKVLVYRYFNGMPGLLRAYGESTRFWPDVAELTGGRVDELLAMAPPVRLATLMKRFARSLRSRPVTVEILAWETVQRNELTEALEGVRETLGMELLELFGSELSLEVKRAIALVGASINYLIIRGRSIRIFSGLALGDEEGWAEFDAAIDTVCRGLMLLEPTAR